MGVADTVGFDLRLLRLMLVVVCEMRPPKVGAEAICVINPVIDRTESAEWSLAARAARAARAATETACCVPLIPVTLDLRRALLWLDAAAAATAVASAVVTAVAAAVAAATFDTDADANVDATVAIGVVCAVAEVLADMASQLDRCQRCLDGICNRSVGG
ncbi:hypothetical protein BASA83_004268 [Batrachochytrium salamandrivorans]|nr:hypothetical protein BASA83_004268 [Batrachochytrium salamandrivorans]